MKGLACRVQEFRDWIEGVGFRELVFRVKEGILSHDDLRKVCEIS